VKKNGKTLLQALNLLKLNNRQNGHYKKEIMNNEIDYLFSSFMVFFASPLLRKYPIILDITDDTDLSSNSAISFRKSSFSSVVLNDKNDDFFIMKIYEFV